MSLVAGPPARKIIVERNALLPKSNAAMARLIVSDSDTVAPEVEELLKEWLAATGSTGGSTLTERKADDVNLATLLDRGVDCARGDGSAALSAAAPATAGAAEAGARAGSPRILIPELPEAGKIKPRRRG
jgi:hypothetical protein